MSQPLSSDAVQSENSGKRLRIAVLNRAFSTTGGGAERYSVALVEQLAARHEIHVFAQEIDHSWPGVHYHQVSGPLPKPRWVNQLWFAFCTWRLTRSGFDVVHSHENTWHGNVQTVHVLPVRYSLFKRHKGWRLLASWVKAGTSPRLLVYLGLEYFRFSVRSKKQLVVTSDSLRTMVEAAYPACSAMVSVITPGITLPQSQATPSRKAAARRLLGLPVNGQCILFVANDFRKKGLEALLAALARCPANFMLAVVGNTAQQSVFAKQVQNLNLGEQVFFIGMLKDMEPAYQAADCLAHPTLEDTFAMVVLEAMSHGLPVIVSGPKYCGVASLLQHGISAWIVDDPKNAALLHEALHAVLVQFGVKDRIGQCGKKFALGFQWTNLALLQELTYFAAS